VKGKIILLFLGLISVGFSLTNLSDNGFNTREVGTGNLVALGNLSIYIYNESSGSTPPLWSDSFTDAIINGSWNVKLENVPLMYGVEYWKAYQINGEDIYFNSSPRVTFFTSIGDLPATAANVAHTDHNENWGANNITATHFYGLIDWTNVLNPPVYNNLSLGQVVASIGNWSLDSPSVARIGNCTPGQFVVNITTSGVQCLAPSAVIFPVYNNLSMSDVVAGVGNWSADSANYTQTVDLPVYQNGSSNLTLPDIEANLGNWTGNTSSYTNTAGIPTLMGNSTIARTGNCSLGQFVTNITTGGVECEFPINITLPIYNNLSMSDVVAGVGNWSADSVNYTMTSDLPVYNNGSSNLTMSDVVAGVGNWSADSINYTMTIYLPVYNNGSSNLTLSDVVSSIGNWSLDSSNYTQTVDLPVYNNGSSNLTLSDVVSSIGNWSLDSANYTQTSDLPVYNNGSVTSITAGSGLTGGTITTSGTIALNDTYVSLLFPIYNNGTSNLTLADIVNSIGNWSFDSSNYTQTVDLPVYNNLSGSDIVGLVGNWSLDSANYTQTSDLPVYNNGSSNLTLSDVVSSIGNWSLDSANYTQTSDLPVYNNGTSNLTLSDVVSSIGNWSLDSGNYTQTVDLPVYNNGSSNLTLSDIEVSLGNWSGNSSSVARIGNCSPGDVVQNTTTSGVECITVSGLFPIYNNGTSNLTLADIVNSIGNWSLDSANYTQTVDLPVYNNGSSNLTLSDIVTSIGNWSLDSGNYTQTADLPVYNNGSSNLTLNDIVTSIGNWSLDSANYTQTVDLPVYNNGSSNLTLSDIVTSIGNWSLDSANYTQTSDLPIYNNGSVTSITAGTGLTGGTITTSGTIALNDTYIAFLFPIYNNGTSNLTLADIVNSIGNWSLDSANYTQTVDLPVYNNLSGSDIVGLVGNWSLDSGNYTQTVDLPVYNNGSSNLTLGDIVTSIGNWSLDSANYTQTVDLPVYNNGSSNLTLSDIVTSIGNWSLDSANYTQTVDLPIYNNGTSRIDTIASIDNYIQVQNGTLTNLSMNETQLNTTINNSISGAIAVALATTTYLPISFYNSSGTVIVAGGNLGNLSYYDNQYFNITENTAGTNPLTLYVNFTNVTNFTSLNLRERYQGGNGHQIALEIYDQVLFGWEGYGIITDQAIPVIAAFPILDSLDHIINGTVEVRLRHIESGKPNHYLEIDMITLSKGLVTYTTNEHDSLSGRNNPGNHPQYLLRDGTNNMTGNLQLGIYNLTAGNIFANINWSYVQNAPIYNNGSSNLTLPQVEANLGNWTGNMSSYTTTANLPVYNNLSLPSIEANLGNWTGNISLYTTTANLPVYNNGTSNLTLAQVEASIGNWSGNMSSYTTTANLPVYNNLTLPDIEANLGNWSGNISSYTTTANLPVYNNGSSNLTIPQVEANLGNWTGNMSSYTTTANLPVYNNLSLPSIEANLGNWTGNASSYTDTAGIPTLMGNSTIARIGNDTCTPGQVVENVSITTSGVTVECVVASSLSLPDIEANLGNWSGNMSSYTTTANLPVYNNGTSNLTLAQVEASIGNWSGNASSYTKLSDLVGLLGNWSADKSSYTTTANLPVYNNGSSNLTLPDIEANLGNWTGNKSSYTDTAGIPTLMGNTTIARAGNDTCSAGQVVENVSISSTGVVVECVVASSLSLPDIEANLGNWTGNMSSYTTTANLPVYNNGTSDLTLAQVVASIGNWTSDKSNYPALTDLVGLLGNWSADKSSYTATSGIVGLVGNWSLDKSSYTATVDLPVYQNGSSNLTITDVMAAVGNWSGNASSYTNTTEIPTLMGNNTIARAGNDTCTPGQVVENVSISSTGVVVECVVASSLSLPDIETNLGNWSGNISSYTTTADLPVYNNLSLPDIETNLGNWSGNASAYAKLSDLVSLLGNWSADKASYPALTDLVGLLGNWSADKSSYTNTAGIPTLMDNSTIARIGDCGAGEYVENITTSGVECSAVAVVVPYQDAAAGWTNTSSLTLTNLNVSFTSGFIMNTTTVKPACAAAERGNHWYDQGGNNVADIEWVCMKNSTNGYAWTQGWNPG